MSMELGEFGRFLAGAAIESEVVKHELIEHGCKVIEAETKRVIGTYDYGWPSLAQSTQDDRVRQGYPADEPLLRSGELRDSIEHTVEGDEGYIGSNNPKARWQFLGTSTIPPRDALGGAAAAKGAEVAEYIGMGYAAALFGGSVVQKLIR